MKNKRRRFRITVEVAIQEVDVEKMARRVQVSPKNRELKRAGIIGSRNSSFRVVGRGNYLYITESCRTGKTGLGRLASLNEIERIMVGLDQPLEIDVQNMSQAQLGNVLRAIKMVDSGNEKIDVSSVHKDGRTLLVAKKG